MRARMNMGMVVGLVMALTACGGGSSGTAPGADTTGSDSGTTDTVGSTDGSGAADGAKTDGTPTTDATTTTDGTTTPDGGPLTDGGGPAPDAGQTDGGGPAPDSAQTDGGGPAPDAGQTDGGNPPVGVCGDGTCDDDEDCASCADDCSPCQLATGWIIITEIMQNPSAVEDAVGEWIEVANVADEPVDLNGLTLMDDDADSHVLDAGGSWILLPGERAVLGASADLGGGGSADYVWSDFLLGNGSDAVILAAGSITIDEVYYDDGDTFPDANGASMRLDDAAMDAASNDSGANWCLSDVAFETGDFGTPGTDNGSCDTTCGDGACAASEGCDACPEDCGECPVCGDGTCEGDEDCASCADDCGECSACGDGTCDLDEDCESCEVDCGECMALVPEAGQLVITEIMKNPDVVDDLVGEWFEVVNIGLTAVALEGLTITDNGTDSHEITGSAVLEPGAYAVLGASDDLGVGVLPTYTWSGVAFGNGADAVALWYGDTLIDAVSYDNGDTFPDDKGVAMSLDPTAIDATSNDDGANWCGATEAYADGDFGTPGFENPACPTITCGDGTCSDGEDCAGCEADCGPCDTCEPTDEVCNGVDDDCDDQTDEDDTLCDDGIGCTADACLGVDGCSNPIAEGYCVIGEACYAAEDANPQNACQACAPMMSVSSWSGISNVACDDQDACTLNDMCDAGQCVGETKDTTDPYEGNNTFSNAWHLGTAEDDETFPKGTVTAYLLPSGDVDWFSFASIDTILGAVEPQVTFSSPDGATYEVCLTLICDEGNEGVTGCTAGYEWITAMGHAACCAESVDDEVTVSLQIDCPGLSDDGTSYVEIYQLGSADVCDPYTLKWGDD